MKQICHDLTWEQVNLDDLVTSLPKEDWDRTTLCLDWTIKDEICHLAYFDYTARLAATDSEAFTQHLIEDFGQVKDMDEVTSITLARGRDLDIDGLLDWWRAERSQLNTALAGLDPKDRLPWYGPPMSALSFATARLMETWAHGQDIYDTLKQKRPVSPGLKHIAHLGVSTFKWSFTNRGQEAPDIPVYVSLTGPKGEAWTWGDATAGDSISGPAEDFCLVVTQRRHVDDTTLVVAGDTARQWMLVAQAFAGPPDNGPPAGMFS